MALTDRFRRGPSFDDRATGKFSGMPGPRRVGPSFQDRSTGKFSGSPAGRRTGPSFSDRATGKFAGSPRATDFNVGNRWISRAGDAVGNLASGIANTGKKMGKGFVHPFQMMAGSIAQNRADHDYLDEVYGKDKGTALWNRALDNYYADVPAESINPAISQYGVTDTGTSFGQARKYFNRSGITDRDLDKFLGIEPSKWAGNEAWLASQADGDKSELFDTGMSFIKNAKASANLRRATEAARNQLADESLPYRSGIEQEGGPSRSYPVDTGTVFEDFRSGIEQEGGAPYSYDVSDVTEDITADVGGSPYTLNALDLMPSDLDEQRQKTIFRNMFTGKRGKDMYEKMPITTYPHDISSYDMTANYPGMNVMDRMSPGEDLMWRAPGSSGADMDRLYMNRIGDVINQGRYSAAPNISVSFGEDEELTPAEKYNPKINPAWNR